MAARGDLIERVGDAIREAWTEVPAAPASAWEKAPGELVTATDLALEATLSGQLSQLDPGAVIVGEEAVAGNPALVRSLGQAPRAWLVDPLDGTANYASGGTSFATMVALLIEGKTVLSWIYRPTDDALYVAERGGGARRDGTPLGRAESVAGSRSARGPAALRGEVLTGFLPPDVLAVVAAHRSRFAAVGPGERCAAVDYPRIAEGDSDFVLFWRTLPWDHAPGALLVQEAGGTVLRPDASPYVPGDGRVGLLAASDEATWHTVQRELLHHERGGESLRVKG